MVSYTGFQNVDELIDSIVQLSMMVIGEENLTKENSQELLNILKKCDEDIDSLLESVRDPID